MKNLFSRRAKSQAAQELAQLRDIESALIAHTTQALSR